MADPETPRTPRSFSSMSKQSISGHSKSKRTSSTLAPSDFFVEVTEVAEIHEKSVSNVPISATPEDVHSYTKWLRDAFKNHLALSGISKESWTDENERALDKFISDPSVRLLIVYRDPFTGLRMDYAMPAKVVEQMSYFIRAEESIITEENFKSLVQFGSVRGGAIEGLLRLMHGVHAPQVTISTAWPESTKNNYSEHMHRFLTNLTDSRFKLLGSTALYIPLEALQYSPKMAVKNKELVYRLEMVMIHWTRQIKAVLNSQEMGEMEDSSGPLEEISFWKSRCADLASISQQLQKPGVCHLQAILQLSKSNYVPAFCKLAKQIQDSTSQAQSNISFLSLLKEPCEELAQLKPHEIPPKLAHILNLIRVIWVNSSYYNNRDRIMALFRKMSNEIIHLCCRAISLDRIFQGYVISSIQILKDCIQCCLAWKELYLHTSQLHHKYSSQGWSLDQTSIFALVDAFVQRFKDLIEVCECQQQFARSEEDERMPLPCFAGRQGSEVTQRLLYIEATFDKILQALRSVKDILSIRNNSWHNHFRRFRAEVKDLEVMIQNLITSAFETVNSVEEGVQLLDVFQHLSAREAIKRTIDKKTADVYALFSTELVVVNEMLARMSSLSPAQMPQHAGQAHWARALRTWIERPMEVLRQAHFLPQVNSRDEVHVAYAQLVLSLDEKVRRIFTDWSQSLKKECLASLDQPLMIRCKEKTGLLDINFNKNLLKMFNEIHYWDRLLFEIPHYVTEVYQRREELRNLRENVLLVVRDYNRIIMALNADELGLFSERIRFLDKKIKPGLSKLHWSTKETANVFINDCRVHANKVQLMVDEYKAANLAVSKLCTQISELLLVHVDGRVVYGDLEFQEVQQSHQHSQLLQLQTAHQDIVNIIARVYRTFHTDGPEVQQHWVSYTEKMDRMVEEAFRVNIKRSLQLLSKAINGDGKTSPNPLFRVEVVLRKNTPGSTAQVDFSPSLQKLAQLVNSICAQLINTISVFRRLPDLLTHQHLQRKPIHSIIEQDEEICKIQAAIATGMVTNASYLQTYLKTWDKHREIWEINKDAFINRYQRLNPPVSSFDADIARYTEVANNVQKEEMVLSLQFVLLDCSLLKFSLLQHCNEWQSKFTQLLSFMASAKLKELHSFLQGNALRVSQPPQTLGELVESLKLLETLQADLSKIESQIPPIHEQFAILEKYEVIVEPAVLELLEALNGEWVWFQQVVIDSDIMLKKHKDTMKSSLILSSEEFKKKTQSALQSYNNTGPFGSGVTPDSALQQVSVLRAQLDALKEEEESIRHGCNIFKIEQPTSKDILTLEKDLDYLQQVWEIAQQWEALWDEWKGGQLASLQTKVMENTAQTKFKRLHKLNREFKDKQWDVVDFTKSRIEQFKKIIPLITDLRNPAMRERHWDQIRHEVQQLFDPNSADFTLEKIVALGLDHHTECISDISGAASKELSIEQALEGITKTWEETFLDITPYKDKGHHRLRGTDEVFQALEDNQVTLSVIKATRFVKAFEKEVDHWERSLSLVLEVIEMILTVQRQWMYLENIFLAEDIRKQLPRETAEFDYVNSSWKIIMDQLNKDKNALRGTHHPGLLEKLSDMNSKLEEIQKSLDMYLETKRQIFPRFYFLSNDDLLEILGQSRNPEAVQPHLKKCFDNIKSLRINKIGISSSKSEASGMFSADGEFVDFTHPVLLEGPVEAWLCDVERTMRCTLKDCLKNCGTALKKMAGKRGKWVRDWPGQMLITASQIQWTTDVTRALMTSKERADKSALKSLKKKQMSMLNQYSEAIRGNLSKILRLKIVALVTVEVHARDVISKLAKAGCCDVNAFDWLCQLRLYWDKDVDDCVIRQTNTHFRYCYEYLGNSGRLVITPLTDRCYMTLTTALHLHRGGSPKGPAGTGKTETVKDLGKALGMYVIVVNCSEGLDFKSMGRMYSGLAQTGAWGCFDEFNRINIEVLSVVAQQILSILSALTAGLKNLIFEGRQINLVWSCGIFITMNPGYAGRTELPDNLKSMFRPISMVVPDSTLIAEITLFAEGFNNCKVLAKKVFTLYSLAVQQLSKQDHYDFGLRALTSLLRYAGKKRRACSYIADEEILLMSMKDMNIAKLTSIDLPLFNGIIQDLFPAVETPTIDYGKLKEAIEAELRRSGLQVTPFTMTKVIQLYETKTSRHSVMIVGKTGSGKTVTWRTLQNALSTLHRNGELGYSLIHECPLNPKAVSLGELYGEYNLATNEWTDGILSSLMRASCADEKPDEKWIVFDGPVDTLWIESMNSVMDDNKVLTLINGERISMPEQVSLLFEVEDLAVASPATVSRCGMVYNDYSDLSWKPYVQSWMEKRLEVEMDHLKQLFEQYMEKTLTFKKTNCKELVTISELNGVSSLCRLYDSLATPENGVNPADSEHFGRMVELWFIFSLIWSVCASVDEDGRKKIDTFLREIEGSFPNKNTIYEYYVDTKNKTWASFEDKLPKGWRYASNAPFYKIMVPTVDTVRYHYLVKTLVCAQHPVLLTGPVGTGKTSVAQSILQSLDSGTWATLTVNMSSQTSSNNVQEIIESRMEKRIKGVYVPVGGKKMLVFLDDLNMPAMDDFGSQPPLELLRLWIDYGFWYDRQKQTLKCMKDIFLLAAMGPPGGGRTRISGRLLSRFNLINMTFPTESQIKRIYGTMISQKLQEFEEDVKPIGEVLTQATLELYHAITARFLPTPAKIHYLFNLRDISKVFQGLLRAHRDFHDTKQSITRLWIHECFRVFSDRLVDHTDMETFVGLLSDKLASHIDVPYHSICPNKQPPVFGDFLKEPHVYEDLLDFKALKVYMETQLEDYNLTPGVVPMSLVLFRDAIEHVTRVVRVISQLRGNMLLVGIGGSGRQSLTRLATFICKFTLFQVEVTKQYRKQEFREDIKKLYRLTGVENKPTVFLFNDTQITDESFLEDINNILSSGEVPNLYKADELDEIQNALSDSARKDNILETPDAMFNYLIERVRNNLHIALCMSPVGDPFRNRIRQYPALVNCTTIDWFCEWPRDALLEVAERCLDGLSLGNVDGIQNKLASIFVTVHQSVAQFSHRMKVELKRHNYVTPTNYLELVSGYKKLLSEKSSELGEQVSKLRNGLFKIDDTRRKVEAMSVELEDAKKKVAEFQKQCEEYLVVIVQQKREADEQQKAVGAHSEKIEAEEIKCKAMAENAQRDLDEAIPALEEAMKALESLNKKDMTEIKSYGRPPALVETVMQAVMILRGCEPTWAEAKRQLGEGNFIKQLVNFDKDNISDRVLRTIGQYCTQPDFQPEIIGRVSLAAKSLCMWVRAMEVYGRIYRVVEPKRARLNGAMTQLAEKQAALADAQGKLREVGEKLDQLKGQYDEKLSQKEELRRKSEDMELKLDRAGKLVSGLAGERVRWEETVAGLEMNMSCLVGDCLLAAAFLSYMGPFLSNYRDELVTDIWMKQVRELDVPCSPGFSFAVFLSKPTAVREWNIQGLPSDAFSTENGVIVTRGNRWPLMVDPQGQALKWIKNMESKRGLKIIDMQMPDFLRILENAVQFGSPVLLQNVQEELDPSLAPILNKSLTRVGGRFLLKLGDKEVEYSPEFCFYMTTKLSNPHYTPEISSKTTIVNFAVKEQGLEAQLLGIVVRKERHELEEQKDSLVMNIASGRRKLQELEDEILRLLNEATGSLLDDVQLVNTLQNSKVTATEVAEQLEISELTESQIDTAREAYRPCAQRASILFFVLNDLGRIDPMYQFSLDSYITLFVLSIESSPRSHKLEERINNLNRHHTYAVYRYTCRGLFECHKLLFSFHMCAKILEASSKLSMDEYGFFLRGGLVLDKKKQMDNPCSSWLSDSNWDNITELNKLTNFHGLMASFEQQPRAWHLWYTYPEPEKAPLPGEWDSRCNELQKMLIVRSLRQDRISLCVTAFVINNLGPQFVEPPILDMKAVVADSTTRTPLIFVLSPGVDPTAALVQLAEMSGMGQRFFALSLGQGQAPIATRLIKEGVKNGHWVFLANCHLSLSWMCELDKLVEELQVQESHPDFRLWLSSSPHPEFPIAILQMGIKITTEPPRGVKWNMKRLYQLVSESQFSRCSRPLQYRKLLFTLCFFHSIILERRKFLQLGWNIIYSFNDSDFEVSENLLSLYLDEYEEIPWDALKFLIAGINYGGHVTDDWDRRLLTTYINHYFCPAVIDTSFFKLSSLNSYYVPRDGAQSLYVEFIGQLPALEHPELFGQHPNADIASQITETRTLFHTLLSLQPQVTSTDSSSTGGSREDKVLELSADVLQKIPGQIDYEGTRKLLKDDLSPLNVVLMQEIQRYNTLLHTIRLSLLELEKGIKGLVVMSSSLEETFHCIHDARVPPLWEKAYPSLKPLASWTRDLCQRVEQFARWAETARPPIIFWLSGFTFPTGFLTAVLQSSARQHNVSVDTLSWEFTVSTVDDKNLLFPPKDGVLIQGLYLEGAGWDKKASCLMEAEPMQLVCPMPTIHFKPVESRKRVAKNMYSCPCYYYPVRSGGSGHPSFMMAVDLKSGAVPYDHWIKRGTALLMSLDS
ncbi:dynein axonemal heavy chain 2 [Myxocyprinus asiaticus]|uniref:dynein axonemal heavy chain 2 n=1 Tax=Myxocyprinus asiaticus TaxID=70543 RepID=UPI0022218DFF|nr:dynein axonemal heavy chain 2 [Myxocyprinus asiaticus]